MKPSKSGLKSAIFHGTNLKLINARAVDHFAFDFTAWYSENYFFAQGLQPNVIFHVPQTKSELRAISAVPRNNCSFYTPCSIFNRCCYRKYSVAVGTVD